MDISKDKQYDISNNVHENIYQVTKIHDIKTYYTYLDSVKRKETYCKYFLTCNCIKHYIQKCIAINHYTYNILVQLKLILQGRNFNKG